MKPMLCNFSHQTKLFSKSFDNAAVSFKLHDINTKLCYVSHALKRVSALTSSSVVCLYMIWNDKTLCRDVCCQTAVVILWREQPQICSLVSRTLSPWEPDVPKILAFWLFSPLSLTLLDKRKQEDKSRVGGGGGCFNPKFPPNYWRALEMFVFFCWFVCQNCKLQHLDRKEATTEPWCKRTHF